MKGLKTLLILLLVLIFLGAFFVPYSTVQDTSKKTVISKDTTKKDTAKTIPGLYKNVDVKIIYPWLPDEPEIYKDVKCRLIKEKGVVTEIWIYFANRKEELQVKKNLITYEVRDAKTKKLIAKGP